MRRYKVNVTTDGSGNATAYSPRIAGKIHQIEYVKDGGANPFANGVDFTITGEATGVNLWTRATSTPPRSWRRACPRTRRSASRRSMPPAGTAVQAPVAMASDRVKISISSRAARQGRRVPHPGRIDGSQSPPAACRRALLAAYLTAADSGLSKEVIMKYRAVDAFYSSETKQLRRPRVRSPTTSV
jgi:hypothetical protein